MKRPKLAKTKFGFYQYHPKPTEQYLRRYYEEKYFQEGRGSYAIRYKAEEVDYFRLKARLIYLKTSQLIDLSRKVAFLDIGCGEGWILNEFKEKGHEVLGFDFSRYGIKKMHPQLLAHFQQGNFVDSINEQIESGSRYDVILLANVIEHVATPGKLLASIKNIMRPKSILIIVAPNDFSVLHEDLLKKKIISKKFWLCYPDHLSYFNKESMTKFLAGLGFNLEAIVADNPIDLNLLNENSNYVREPDKAKKTHMFRVRADNFLGSVDLEKLLRIYEILGSMGIGRDLNYYCTKTI